MTVKECEERITQLDSSLGELRGEVAAIKVGCQEMSTRLGFMEKQMTGITNILLRLEALAFSGQDRGKGTTSSSFDSPKVSIPLLDHGTSSLGSSGISSSVETHDSMLKKIDMPVFDGRLPFAWISRAERFFRLVNCNTDEEKLDIVSLSLAGDCLTWYKEELPKSYFTNWLEFKKVSLLDLHQSRVNLEQK
ncbi:unnamed protein product [Microthlaspi erraticum]|uniref:Retrotransposon gag domain-containing protein n=1 Tax=Microthlaspi erraticum TaxID=1685480 RepID=A0A6D2L8K1_9BRAS|nr:unnamed protein product [Microthlaspi erraticum]